MMFMFMFMVVLFTFGMSVYRHLHMGAGNATFHRGLGCELHPGYTQGVQFVYKARALLWGKEL